MTRAEKSEALYTWLRPRHVAERLDLPLTTIYAHIRAGTLRATDFRKPCAARADYRIRPEWVAEFEEARHAA